MAKKYAILPSDDISEIMDVYPIPVQIVDDQGASITSFSSSGSAVIGSVELTLDNYALEEGGTLATISGQLPSALGQALSAASFPVVLASDHGDVPVFINGQDTYVDVSIRNGQDVALGSTTDAPASSSVAEDATARTSIALQKALKNIAILINAKMVSGTTIGATQDAGPSQAVTRLLTESADMTTAAAITNTPASGQKIVATDILVSTDTSMKFTIQMETSENKLSAAYIPAYGAHNFCFRGLLKGDAADKKLFGKASVSGNVSITAIHYSEA